MVSVSWSASNIMLYADRHFDPRFVLTAAVVGRDRAILLEADKVSSVGMYCVAEVAA